MGGPRQALVGEGGVRGHELGIAVGRQIDRGESLVIQRVREWQRDGDYPIIPVIADVGRAWHDATSLSDLWRSYRCKVVGVEVAVGVGVGVNVAVAVGVGVDVAVAVGVGLGLAVAVAVGVGLAVGVGVGVPPPIGPWIVNHRRRTCLEEANSRVGWWAVDWHRNGSYIMCRSESRWRSGFAQGFRVPADGLRFESQSMECCYSPRFNVPSLAKAGC